jgi:hypothetical protein
MVQPREQALLELSEAKWAKGFVCRNCGNDTYYNIGTEFSRKCTACKKLDTVTAGTIFSKIRMPIEHALIVIKTMLNERTSKLTDVLKYIDNRYGIELDTKATWKLIGKVEKAVPLHTVQYDKTLVIAMLSFKGKLQAILCSGMSKGKVRYFIKRVSIVRFKHDIESYLDKNSAKSTLVDVFDYGQVTKNVKRPLRIATINRKTWLKDESINFSEVKQFKEFMSGHHIKAGIEHTFNFYCYLKNGGTYSTLLPFLINPEGAKLTP